MSGLHTLEPHGAWGISILTGGTDRRPCELRFQNTLRGDNHVVQCKNVREAKQKVRMFRSRLELFTAQAGFEPDWKGIK